MGVALRFVLLVKSQFHSALYISCSSALIFSSSDLSIWTINIFLGCMSDLAKPCLHSNPRKNACGKRCMRCACSLVYLFVRLRPSSCLVAPFAKAFRAWSLAPAMSHRVLDEEMSEASSSRDELHKTAPRIRGFGPCIDCLPKMRDFPPLKWRGSRRRRHSSN